MRPVANHVPANPAPAGGVVLLHGIVRTARSLRRMQDALEAAGFATLNLDYQSRAKPLQALVSDIHPSIDQFSHTVEGPLHVVAHSMGGLLARAYLAKHPPRQLGRVLLLGPPNGGSEIADLLKRFRLYRVLFGPAGQQLVTQRDEATRALLVAPTYPVGIISGDRSIDPIAAMLLPHPNDGRVAVASTRLEGMADHIVIGTSHPWLVRHPQAIAQTIAFLRDGRFSRPS
jgi:pimeloyl-ACP methyl ester carboxylesterase